MEILLYRFDLGDRERKRGNETGAGQEMIVTPAQSYGKVEHVRVNADTDKTSHAYTNHTHLATMCKMILV